MCICISGLLVLLGALWLAVLRHFVDVGTAGIVVGLACKNDFSLHAEGHIHKQTILAAPIGPANGDISHHGIHHSVRRKKLLGKQGRM